MPKFNLNIDDGFGGSDVADAASGTDMHLDITFIQNAGSWKVIPFFRTF